MAIERVVEYVLKVRNFLSHRLPKVEWEASMKIQKTYKSKILSSGWMQDIKKWFGRWDAEHLLDDASLDPTVNEAFLQRQVKIEHWGTREEALCLCTLCNLQV